MKDSPKEKTRNDEAIFFTIYRESFLKVKQKQN